MNPLDRVRIEKAAADCGFEMPLTEQGGALQLRSARFPEVVTVRPLGAEAFEVGASNHALLRDATTLHGYAALYDTLRTLAAHARTLPNRVADAFRHQTAALPRTTEAERLVIQRVGQDLFRAALLDFWQGRCCVTGLALAPLLRASHIKPWAACDNDNERLDVFNGLLLAPHVDALFDGGWITFADDGALQVSAALPPAAAACLGLKMDWAIHGLAPAHGAYLQFHRSQVFRASAPAA
ncbi:hypothetical protein MASR1M50_25920 [Burkholderiales bacterium]